NFPRSIGIKFKRGKYDDCRSRAECSCFFPSKFNLIAIQQAELRTEGYDYSFGLHPLGFSVRVQPPCTSQWLDPHKVNVVSALAAQSRFEQFVSPFRVTKRRAFASHGRV